MEWLKLDFHRFVNAQDICLKGDILIGSSKAGEGVWSVEQKGECPEDSVTSKAVGPCPPVSVIQGLVCGRMLEAAHGWNACRLM